MEIILIDTGWYSEQARLLGIDFQSVYGRGSQFKVESMMIRIGKPEGFMMVSPSKKQVSYPELDF